MDSSACETNSSDDIFANSSAETVVENIDFSLVLKQANMLINSDNNTIVTGILKNDTIRNANLYVEDCKIESRKKDLNEPSDKSSISNCIISKILNFPLKLHCPFCCSAYTSQTMLKGHLKDKHLDHLENLAINKVDSYISHVCNYCHAQYNTIDILMKHIVQTHQDNIIVELLLQEKLEDKNISCVYCPYKILLENKHDLLAHIEECHFTKLKSFVEEKLSQKVQFSPGRKNDSGTGMSVLNNLVQEMSINNVKDKVDTSVGDKVLKSNFYVESPSSGEHKKQVRNVRFQLDDPKTRKKLNFNQQDEKDFEKANKENIISCSTNLKLPSRHTSSSAKIQTQSKWKSVFSFRNKHIPKDKKISNLVTSTPTTVKISQSDVRKKQTSLKSKDKLIKETLHKPIVKRPLYHKNGDGKLSSSIKRNNPIKILKKEEISLPVSPLTEVKMNQSTNWTPPEEPLQQYKCGICLQAFVNNVDLISHVHQHHTGPLKILQPLYKCGQCEAKFYKNSFLLRHCKFHHTPRCLKNKLPA